MAAWSVPLENDKDAGYLFSPSSCHKRRVWCEAGVVGLYWNVLYLWRKQIFHQTAHRLHQSLRGGLSRTAQFAWDILPALGCCADARTSDPEKTRSVFRLSIFILQWNQAGRPASSITNPCLGPVTIKDRSPGSDDSSNPAQHCLQWGKRFMGKMAAKRVRSSLLVLWKRVERRRGKRSRGKQVHSYKRYELICEWPLCVSHHWGVTLVLVQLVLNYQTPGQPYSLNVTWWLCEAHNVQRHRGVIKYPFRYEIIS